MKNVCNVTNKSSGSVVYAIPEDGIRREYAARETKKNISVQELEKLIQKPGGKELFYNYLYIDDREILDYLVNAEIAPEYWITEDKIPSWMTTCSLDEFKDALDFAPEGTKDLIKKYALAMPLNDYSKRAAIKDQLGLDIEAALKNSGTNDAAEPVKPTGRRVPVTQASNGDEAAARKVVVKAAE